ncbi:MAG: hypothetical protein L6Q38_17245 [Nitrospira sp.]|nr:hypothetical protein [Planctomycetota bacterium]MCK6501229.1 hypothetical protein [Nitrospira sp.]NUQ34848.1 hypothetical protein [Planctomycetaceae bacterium]
MVNWLPYHNYARLRPVRGALHYATSKYGQEIDHFYFIAGGAPVPHLTQLAPNGIGSSGSNIVEALQEFPAWFAPLAEYGCELTVVQIGEDPSDLGGVGDLGDQDGDGVSDGYLFEWGKDPAAKTFMMDLAAQNNGKYIKK